MSSSPQYFPGTRIWIPAQDGLTYAQAVISTVVDDFTLRTTEGLVLCKDILPCNDHEEDDITSLKYIHDAGILYNLETRSLRNAPYTFMGPVLVLVNPLKRLSNPTSVGTAQVLSDAGGPHPYIVAELAFAQMRFAMHENQSMTVNQSIVIGGESGSGKTDCAKMVLQHLVARSAAQSGGLDDKLLGTNPILEAFGNAPTLRNPNSSRFGKMLRLHFDSRNELIGATVQSYLLERSRVISHVEGERGYHVMYMLCGACSNSSLVDSGDLHITGDPLQFKYLQPLDLHTATSPQQQPIEELVQAMQAVGLDNRTRQEVFEIVAGILHLGNLEFRERLDINEGGACPTTSLDVVSRLLGVDADALSNAFCQRRFVVAGKEMITVRNARAAAFAKDAVAKAVYAGLFNWIIKQINAALGGSSSSSLNQRVATAAQIGVLDIFGFEAFAQNGFEQLLINYANEALQRTFHEQIFIAEQNLYENQGLVGLDDNQASSGFGLENEKCVELLQGRAGLTNVNSLLMTIDSEGRVPDPSDAKMNRKIHANFAIHVCMVKTHPKDKATTFAIKHYAAAVTYTVGSFLEKNYDLLPDDVESSLKTSKKAIMREIFVKVASVAGGANTPKKPTRSVIYKFQTQMKQLVDDLQSTQCSFIRCVKPNRDMIRPGNGNEDDSSWFDRRYVQKQLHALNIPQTVQVLRVGFPTRVEYKALRSRVPLKFREFASTDDQSFVRALFYAFDINQKSFKLGRTKVFFKSGQLAELDSIFEAMEAWSEIVCKRFRFYVVKCKWRRAAVGVLAQRCFQDLHRKSKQRVAGMVRFQSFVRMHPHRRAFLDAKRGALVGQRMWRGKMGRNAARQQYEVLKLHRQRLLEELKQRRDVHAAKLLAEELAREEQNAEEKRKKQARIEMEKSLATQLAMQRQQVEEEKQMKRMHENRRKSRAPRKRDKVVMVPPVQQDLQEEKRKRDEIAAAALAQAEEKKRLLFYEKVEQEQRVEFNKSATGYLTLRVSEGGNGNGLLSRLLLLRGTKWQRRFYVVDRPGKTLKTFKDANSKTELESFTLKMYDTFDVGLVRKYCVGVKLALEQVLVVSFDTENAKTKFLKHVEDAAIGFRPVFVVDSAAVMDVRGADPRVVAQLNLLLAKKQITLQEFEGLLARARSLFVAREEERQDVDFFDVTPLRRVLIQNVPYGAGKLSLGDARVVRTIDYVSFEEIVLEEISLRFYLEEHPNEEIAWSVQHSFHDFIGLYEALKLGMMDLKKLPVLSNISSVSELSELEQSRVVEDWIRDTFSLARFVGGGDAQARPSNLVNSSVSLDPSNWRNVRDPVSGETYWSNKITGETKWGDCNPWGQIGLLDSAAPLLPPLPPGWRQVLDLDANESYYVNADTDEVTWDRPHGNSGVLDVAIDAAFTKTKWDELLNVQVVDEFFDLSGQTNALSDYM